MACWRCGGPKPFAECPNHNDDFPTKPPFSVERMLRILMGGPCATVV